MCALRKYMKETKDINFDFESDIPPDISITELFSEITRRLEVKYSIDKGVLVIKNDAENCFAAVSTWKKGELRDGLSINLPNDSSLFARVADDGIVYTEEFSGIFSGNFFERKLLLEDDTKSYVLHPLKFEGKVIGLVGYSSAEPTSFTMFEQGAIVNITDQFAEIITKRKYAS